MMTRWWVGALVGVLGRGRLAEDEARSTAQAVTVGAEITLPTDQSTEVSGARFGIVPTSAGWLLGSSLADLRVQPFASGWLVAGAHTVVNTDSLGPFAPVHKLVLASRGNDTYAAWSSAAATVQRLTASGQLVGVPIAVGGQASGAFGRVALSAFGGGAAIVWSETNSTTSALLRVARVSNGGVVGDAGGLAVTGTLQPDFQSFAVDCTASTCAILWWNPERAARGSLYLRRWTPGVGFVDSAPVLVASNVSAAAIANDGTHFAVVASEGASAPFATTLRRFAVTGAAIGQPTVFATGPSDRLSVTTGAPGFGVLAVGTNATFLRADANGAALGSSVTLPAFATNGSPEQLIRTASGWSAVYADNSNHVRRIDLALDGTVTNAAGRFYTAPAPNAPYGVAWARSNAYVLALRGGQHLLDGNGTLRPNGFTPWWNDVLPRHPLSFLGGESSTLIVSQERPNGILTVYTQRNGGQESTIVGPTGSLLADATGDRVGSAFLVGVGGSGGLRLVRLAASNGGTLYNQVYPGDTRSLGLAMGTDATLVVRDKGDGPSSCVPEFMLVNHFGVNTNLADWPGPCVPGSNIPVATNGTSFAVARNRTVTLVAPSLALSTPLTLPFGDIIALGWNDIHWVALTRTPHDAGSMRLHLWRITTAGALVDTAGIFVAFATNDDAQSLTTGQRPYLNTNPSSNAVVFYRRPACGGSQDVPSARFVQLTGAAVTTPLAMGTTGCAPAVDAGVDAGMMPMVDAGQDSGPADTGHDAGVDVVVPGDQPTVVDVVDSALDVPATVDAPISVDVPSHTDTSSDVPTITDRGTPVTDVPVTPTDAGTDAGSAPTDPPDDGGCSVRPASSRTTALPFAVLALTLTLARITRRRRTHA